MPQIEVALEDMEQYVRWTLSPLSERLLGTFWPGEHPVTTALRPDTVQPRIHMQALQIYY
jgi:hypothetical protein